MQQELQNKKGLVNNVFDKSYDKYDLMNDIMSLGIHRIWKKDLIFWMSPKENKNLIDVASGTGDIAKLFSKLTNNKSKGFRAPTFSLDSSTSWIIDCLEEKNYTYDSSIVPAKSSMYGHSNAQENPYKISSKSIENSDEDGKLTEYPLLVTKFLNKKIPAGGGFYLRTLPLKIIKNAIKNYEKRQIPATFYIHSWELTPEFMPRIKLSKKDDFITYHNIGKAYGKMDELLNEFSFTSFSKYSL